MSNGGFRHLRDEVRIAGRLTVTRAFFHGPDGTAFDRLVVRSPGAVAVVPVVFDPEGNPGVVLLRQYRPAVDRWMLEIPAGLRDVPGEPPEDTARRELAEEAGLVAGRLELLTWFHNAAGFTDARTEVFLGLDLEPTARAAQSIEEEAMTVEQVPLADAVELAVTGSITDAKTVIGLLLAHRRLQGLR